MSNSFDRANGDFGLFATKHYAKKLFPGNFDLEIKPITKFDKALSNLCFEK